MKAIYLIVIALFLALQTDYDKFINLFKQAKYDENGNYLTRGLNSKDYSDLPEEYPLISDANSFYYLCDKDSSKFQYKYDIYNMDEDRYMGLVKERYKHYAIVSFRKGEYDMIVFSKFDDKGERFILRSYDKEGRKIDELVINEVLYEGTSAVPDFFCFSLIANDSIKVFLYDDVKNLKTPFQSSVFISDYVIDNVGRFKKVAVDSVYLPGLLTKYAKFNNEPEVDDPVHKYWTLW